jgi:predicted Holliday junction resolvase-like endonuclease
MTVLADNEKEITLAEEMVAEIENDLRVEARARGRRSAQKAIGRIDRVFSPRRLHADDAKVLLHPVDYIVFNGMNSSDSINRVVLLDRISTDTQRRRLQRSIEKTIERGSYEWVTLRVSEDGSITEN